jgi:hypothetical protein
MPEYVVQLGSRRGLELISKSESDTIVLKLNIVALRDAGTSEGCMSGLETHRGYCTLLFPAMQASFPLRGLR